MRPIVALLALLMVALLGVPGAAATTVHPGNVENFSFHRFHADYVLGRDDDGRSTLTTTEVLVARFPDVDQNRGIRRQLPDRYQGIPTGLEVISVTDESGRPRPYEVSSDDGIVTITAAVPEGQFVRGVQTYVITYTQSNVTDYFANSDSDEFFWNLNGTDWAQTFDRVTATVTLDDDLERAQTGGLFCYQGSFGSTDQCGIERRGDQIRASSIGPILPYQNVTIAVGFAPGTFTTYDRSYLASPWAILQLLGLALSIGTAIVALVLRIRFHRDAPGRPTIIAEYLPPKDLTLLEASVLLHHRQRAVASQIVDFAVRRNLTIVEVPKGMFGRSTWMLRLETADGANELEQRLLRKLFGSLTPGTEHVLKAQNTTLSAGIAKLLSSVSGQIIPRGWRRIIPARHAVTATFLGFAAMAINFVGGVNVAQQNRGGDLTFVLLLPSLIAVVVIGAALWRMPLTPAGAEIRDHIEGLDEYIRLAEADRLRVLQSPQGALREPIDPTNRGERLKLVERLLPWAVMLKREKEWAKELGSFYEEGQSPSWYSGSSAFTVASFAAGVGSVSSTMSSSYSGSSSSGGSGGGGSSGGGGGGGGGGGV